MTALVESGTWSGFAQPTGAMWQLVRDPVRRPPVKVIYILGGQGTFGTSIDAYKFVIQPDLAAHQTSPGVVFIGEKPAAASVAELRRLSGFTWDQLARLFNVSRRALHFWASGKPMTVANEEHLQRLIATVRRIDRGSASANRALLLSVRDDGSIPFDLLAGGAYETVVDLIGPSDGQLRKQAPQLSKEAREARMPEEPAILAGALQDRVHKESVRVRAAKSVRFRGGK